MKSALKRNNSNVAPIKPLGASNEDSESKGFTLAPDLLKKIHDRMVLARCLEERQIQMYKQSDGYFWIGGPGEEAFNIPLGLQFKKGQGIDYDWLHLHYRSSGILLAMGAEPIDFLRQMKNTANDPFSGGRNFGNHASYRKWNVPNISSIIGTQYVQAIGTGIAQAQKNKYFKGSDAGISFVNGGDAGTAEGDFASCLVWASRPALPLPILIVVTNNGWGISTCSDGQHGEKNISDRARAFGIRAMTINGNDVEESYYAIQESMEYIRSEGRPAFIEAKVSRLYGHSSASGANFHPEEVDPLVEFEAKLEREKVLTRAQMTALREKYTLELQELSAQVKKEPLPDPSTIYDHVYYGQKGRYW